MRIELDGRDGMVLRGVTCEAWEYIQAQRLKHGSECWVLGRENRGGTVAITVTPLEDKTEIIRVLNGLKRYGRLTVSKTSLYVLKSWQTEAEAAWTTKRACETERALERQIQALKTVLRDGCRGCSYFELTKSGDDWNGCCTALGRTELERSVYSFEGGGFDERGVWHVGQRFLPGGSCIYLKYREEII